MFGWTEIDRTFQELEALGFGNVPDAELKDEGDKFVLRADVPGLAPEAISLDATAFGLTISAERKLDADKEWKTHRRERRSMRFQRAFRMPVKIDPDNVSADVKNGVLTVTLPKAAEVQPRRVSITH